jgi:hypothetical protein
MDLSKQAEIPTVRKDGMLDELGFSGPPRPGMQIRSTGMLKQDKVRRNGTYNILLQLTRIHMAFIEKRVCPDRRTHSWT